MTVRILQGDCRDVLRTLADASAHCVVTSPPYFGLRDYGVDGQMGLEATPDEFVAGMVAVFSEVRRVLCDDGTLWLNIGDSYASSGGAGWQGKNGQRADRRFTAARDSVGLRSHARTAFADHKPKDLLGIPWMLAFALRAEGWYLRQDIIWAKPNPMPESVRDRCTKAHEYLFLLSKSARYYFDADAIAEGLADSSIIRLAQPNIDQQYGSETPSKSNGPMKAVGHGVRRNKRSVWTVATQPFAEAHFATFPPALIEPCILAGCPQGGVVLDPFGGAGTTGLVADRHGRNAILIELNPEYAAMSSRRIVADAPIFAEVATA